MRSVAGVGAASSRPDCEGHMLKLLHLDGTPFAYSVDGRLRLLPHTEPCHGYENACICTTCKERASQPSTAQAAPAQPWEPKAAA